MDNYTPTRDWIAAFNEAKKIKNIDKMDALFRELAAEVGLTDSTSIAAQAEAGKRIAEMMNGQNPIVVGKKI